MITSTRDRVTTGKVLALALLLAALASLMLAAKPADASTTFTVVNTNSNDEGTLRAAILDANATQGADTIEFDIPGTGVQTIAPNTPLPTITDPVTINGYSQPGAQANTKAVGSDTILKIELSGVNLPGANGLQISAANSTVKGLVINNWSTYGIRIDGAYATGNKITGNHIGTDASGTQDLGNGQGVRVYEGSNNTIGGTTVAARNVISGNADHGVSIGDGGPNITGNKVIGNYIGTDATGTKALGNGSDGISIEDLIGTQTNTIIGGTTVGERNVISGNGEGGVAIYGSGNKVAGNYIGTDATGTKALENDAAGVYVDGTNNTLGGSQAGARNVISANDDAGVTIYGTGTISNKIIGNFIGTDKSGTNALGNADQGVFIGFAANNTVGGTSAGERNVISANGDFGLLIFGTGARGNKVLGNYIGTDKGGAAPLGNSNTGVSISGAPSNTIGGTTAGARNVISANGVSIGDGVEVYGDTATGNRILSNSIFANGELGIDLLGTGGPTANDPGDTDTGPNNLQNKPVLSSARKSSTGTTTVRGTLNSTPDKTFNVQFFSNPEGTNEGKTLLGSKSVSTNGKGNVSFTFSTQKAIRLGQNITATATGAYGTSEISGPRKVVAQ